MTELEFKKFTQKYHFVLYAGITKSSDGHAGFSKLDSSCKGFGYVYIWLEKNEGCLRVVYVGHTEKTTEGRCRQHAQGFKGGSKTGQKHSKKIIDGINKGKTYSVYVRKSETRDIFREKGISMSCVEELAFIKKLRPHWNSM